MINKRRRFKGVAALGMSFVYLSLGLSSGATAAGTTLSFDEIWQKIDANSPIEKASAEQAEAAKIHAERVSNIWAPRVYADVRAYRTDDPAMSFMSILNQREIQNSDFTPDHLNHPEAQTLTRASLGVNLALYEGGAKTAAKEAYQKSAEARGLEHQAVRTRQYSAAAKMYALLLSAEREAKALNDLAASLDGTLARYQVGGRANPVGYSGLLGMKTLKNRISGLSEASKAKANALRSALSAMMGDGTKDWQSDDRIAADFAHEKLTVPDASPTMESMTVKAARTSAEAGARGAEGEKARFLPQVGVFGETALVNGSRASASGSTVGVYLQWSLFNAEDHGAVREARTQAAAQGSYAEAIAQKERIERDSASTTVTAGERNLALLDDSDKLLSEQIDLTRRLFQNGSINALQFVEVLSRRLDLIESRTQVESTLIEAYASRFSASATQIPSQAGGTK